MGPLSGPFPTQGWSRRAKVNGGLERNRHHTTKLHLLRCHPSRPNHLKPVTTQILSLMNHSAIPNLRSPLSEVFCICQCEKSHPSKYQLPRRSLAISNRPHSQTVFSKVLKSGDVLQYDGFSTVGVHVASSWAGLGFGTLKVGCRVPVLFRRIVFQRAWAEGLQSS